MKTTRWVCAALLALLTIDTMAQADMRHMRGVHATSNYGVNVQGFRQPVFGTPKTIAADAAQVSVTRSSGAFGTWDTAAVRLQGVTIGGGPRLASAGFWVSRNALTREISLAFNPSMDAALVPVSGFAGDVNLPRFADGSTVDLAQMARASGVARDLITAVVHAGAQLVGGATFQVAAGAGLDRASVMEVLDQLRGSILLQDDARGRYFAFLKQANVEWVAVTVPIFVDSIADPTVRVKYRPTGDTSGEPYTFDDADLQGFIVQARRSGLKVALAFEFYPVIMAVSPSSPGCGTPQYKPNRWLLGQPQVDPALADQACIRPADWWWNPSHPLHAVNVAAFFNSYTQIAVKYAAMAQQAGVDLFALATEQDNLFRTRPGSGMYTNDFRAQLGAMVAAVRAQYGGAVTVEQLWTAFAHPEWNGNGQGTAQVWSSVFSDLNLDVVGVSAYFDLAAQVPTRLMSVAEFELAWDAVFRNHLLPLKARNPGKPLVLTEWGYTNAVEAPALQGARLGEAIPAGQAGVDGMAQQKNIVQAFFNVNARHGEAVNGSFLYGVNFQDPGDCQKVTFGIYCKPAAEALASGYAQWLKADAERVFQWAQRSYPAMFPGNPLTGSALGYIYRYYPSTGTYLGVKDGRVAVHDGRTWNFSDAGALRTFLDLAGRAGF